MRNILVFLSICLMFACNAQHSVSDANTLKRLNKMYEDQNYFELQSTLEVVKSKLSGKHEKYFRALTKKVFNNPEQSNSIIEELLTQHAEELSDTLLNKIYHAKLLNHVNLYQYKDVAATSEIIQNKFISLNDSAAVASLQNEFKIWNALKNVPPQKIERLSDSEIPLVRDHVGLFNIDVAFGSHTKNFIFDTGANLSVVVRSLVDSLNLKVIKADFYVTAATGKKVKSDLAVAEELRFGNVTAKNVVFLVFNDEDLSFPAANFYPNGIIGYPVIEALEELRFTSENSIVVPKEPVQYDANNLALDGLMPVVKVKYKGKDLRFNFDTGARQTSLYHLFYHDFQEEIDQTYTLQTMNSSSAGGTVSFQGYVIDALELQVANSKALLKDIQLHKERIDSKSNMHGNFGQDYIKQFDEMIISFKNASVIFIKDSNN